MLQNVESSAARRKVEKLLLFKKLQKEALLTESNLRKSYVSLKQEDGRMIGR